MRSMIRTAALALLAGCSSILGLSDPQLIDAGGPGSDGATDGTGAATFALTAVVTGGAVDSRTLKSGDGAIDCGATCMHDYASGSQVTLTATAVTGKGQVFQTWTGDCAGAGNAATCTLAMTQARSVGATFAAVNYVFISSATFNPSLGIGAGDTLCQTEATTRGFPGAGQYVAWLSNTSVSAKSKIATARGWVRLDGLPVLDSPADVTKILYPPRLGALGQDLTAVSLITGTDGSGASAANCQNFMSNDAGQMAASGQPGGGAGAWTNATTVTCNGPDLHVYCFGTSAVTQVAPPTVPGRVAFVSDGVFNPSAGRGAADTLCQTEATANRLTGNYLALVSLTAEAAGQRFDTTGATWVRRDGVPITTQAQDLIAGDNLIAAFDVTGMTKYLDQNERIWTGSDKPNTSGMGELTTCRDWSNAGGSGAVGVASSTIGFNFFHSESLTCDTRHRVYCLQQ